MLPHQRIPPYNMCPRKRREMKRKARLRAAQYAAGGGGEDGDVAPDDERMFSLGDLPGGCLLQCTVCPLCERLPLYCWVSR